MRCASCPNKQPLKKVLKTMKFDQCGLDYITLLNVPTYHCPQCGEDNVEIPNPVELMKVIVRIVVHKEGALTPQEFTFMRKWLGYSRKQLADSLAYSYEHLNRIEKGTKLVPIHLERMVRLLAAAELKCGRYALLDKKALTKFKKITVRPTSAGWEQRSNAV